MTWGNLKKQTFQIKEQLTPLQNAEAAKVKVQVEEHNVIVEEFRTKFKANGPFQHSEKFTPAFETLADYALQIQDLEKRSSHLNEMQDLFDLTVTE